MSKISDMRENYDRATLDEAHVDADAMKQFHIWFQEARGEDVVEPNAMIMSTVDKEGHPTSRTLLLKGLEEDGFVFYTNYNSDKAQEIAENPNISLLFLWKKVQRQVRVSGIAQKISKEESEAYFHSRPKGSQIGAWVSPQSQVISDKSVLETRKAELIEKYKDSDKLPLPDFWGGYKLEPQKMEFWQGRPNRLHDRLRYTFVDGKWKIERLAP
jgi:pyridoxamine 5'-phosphate oxidase